MLVALFTPDKSDNAPPELKSPLLRSDRNTGTSATQQLSRWGFIPHSRGLTIDIGHFEM